MFQRVGDDGHFKEALLQTGDRQADAVDGDGTFLHHVGSHPRGQREAEQGKGLLLFDSDYFSDGVHVTLDEVPPQSRRGQQGQLQVDGVPRAQISQV